MSVGNVAEVGAWHLQAGTNSVTFCANLFDALESNITPREELPFGKYIKVSSARLHRATQEIWRWLAAAGLCVLGFEWWYYHRRTA